MGAARQHDVDDVLDFDVGVVRRHGRAPAHMHAHALGRQIAYRVVERRDIDGDDLAVVGEWQVEIDHVPQHREVGDIELEDEAGLDDRLVFAPHHVGKRVDVVLVGLVVAVLEIARDLARGGRGHEDVLGLRTLQRRFRKIDVGLRCRPVLPRDRPVAGGAVLERRGEVLENFRKLGKLRLAGTHRRRAFAFVARQPLEHVHGVVGAALLAIIDDVEPAFDLPAHDAGNGLTHGCLQLGTVRAGVFLFGDQLLYDFRRAWQAAGMGGEDTVCHDERCSEAAHGLDDMLDIRRRREAMPDQLAPFLEVGGFAEVLRMVFQCFPLHEEPIALRHFMRPL